MQLQKIYLKCLSLLGFFAMGSCDLGLAEYGTPSAAYKVVGKVTSEKAKEPIQNIQVVMKGLNGYGNSDTAYTDSAGSFSVGIRGTDMGGDAFFYMDFTDTSGAYSAKRDSAVFKNAQFENGDDWYYGEAKLDMGTVELTPSK